MHFHRRTQRHRRIFKDGHQSITQRLDQQTAASGDRLAQLRHGARHQQRSICVAQHLIQPGAAAQIGEQNEAYCGLTHGWLRPCGVPSVRVQPEPIIS